LSNPRLCRVGLESATAHCCRGGYGRFQRASMVCRSDRPALKRNAAVTRKSGGRYLRRVGEGEGFVVKLEDANAAAPSGSPAGKARRRTERRLCRSDLGGAFGCEQWEHAPMHPKPMCMRRCCCTLSHVCVAVITRELMFLTGRLRGRYGRALLGRQPCGQRRRDGREAASFGAPAYSPSRGLRLLTTPCRGLRSLSARLLYRCWGKEPRCRRCMVQPACPHHSTADCLLCRPESTMLYLLLVAPITNSSTFNSRVEGAFLTCQKQSIECSLPHSYVLLPVRTARCAATPSCVSTTGRKPSHLVSHC